MAWIGLDLGGTKVYGVVVEHGVIKSEAKRKTPASGAPDAVVEAMVAVVDDLGGARKIKGIGVGAPGLIDHNAGVVKRAPNLAGWTDDFPLARALGEALGTGATVTLANDV